MGKLPQMQSELESKEAKVATLKEEIKQAQDDRAAAKAAMKEATGIREKEAAEYAKVEASTSKDIKALHKAVDALEKGMGGSFLQSSGASFVRKIVASKQDMDEQERHDVLSFLSGEEGYAP